MNTPIRPARPLGGPDTPTDAQIDALLSPEEDASIVDSLFAVARGRGAAEARDVLEEVLFARLQARLARRMRRTIDEPKRCRSAA